MTGSVVDDNVISGEVFHCSGGVIMLNHHDEGAVVGVS